MGSCCAPLKHLPTREKLAYSVPQLSETQVDILRLIYSDLADRTVERKINLQNFILFFHKNGLWGERLYREFDFALDNNISQQQFLTGIARIFKSEQKEKIHLLYKFFSRQQQDQKGVRYKDFLAMLYNYPKGDLKEILNDKDFIEFQLKKNMPKGHLKRRDTLAFINNNTRNSRTHHQQGMFSETSLHKMTEYSQTQQEVTSIVGEHIIQNLKTKPHQTMIKFKDGNDVFEIKTSNIQQIVKEFARKIFSDAKVDRKTGRLDFDKFYNWIRSHKALYQNYYESFHYQIWGTDQITTKPGFLSKIPQNKSIALLLQQQSIIAIQLYLFHSILVLCGQQACNPICIICLQGLAVDKIYDSKHGFGISITHRDKIYVEKKIFFKNQESLNQWLQHLKFYKGESIHQKYTIGQKIGAGKFSVVYKCKHNIENKQYALKQITTYKLQKQSIDLIAHQSVIMKIISHPLLIGFKQCIQTKNHIYIVTELVDGLDLFQFVKQKRYLSEYQGAKIAQMIIVGVSYLHSLGIIHRDLKPENIMVQNRYIQVVQNEGAIEVIKIIDFGFSNYLSELKKNHAGQIIVGTPNYIAPQLLKEEQFDFKIDNFAIGAIIYYMLTGNLPFNDFSIGQILKNTMKGQYKFPQRRSLSENSIDLISKLLQNNPKQRYSLQEALSHPWFEILKKVQARDDRKKSTILNL